MKWIVGVDEAGRGALAGPVAVGAVLVPHDFDWRLIPGVADSKKVTPKNREAIFGRAHALSLENKLAYAVSLIPHTVIDEEGIVQAVKEGIIEVFDTLSADPDIIFVKLDGLLSAPSRFVHQQTIIKGDASEREISLASIMAKVTRDRYMVDVSKSHALYGFEVHKGYGTKYHRDQMREYGLSALHRRSYSRGIVKQAFSAHTYILGSTNA